MPRIDLAFSLGFRGPGEMAMRVASLNTMKRSVCSLERRARMLGQVRKEQET